MTLAKEPTNRRRNRLTPVLLALAAVIAALTVYVSFRTPPPPPPTPEGPTLADRVIARAETLIQSGDPVQAIETMENYVRDHPDDLKVRPLLAKVLMKMGGNEEAEHVVDDFLHLAPDPRMVWRKGELLKVRGKKYMPVFDQAIKLAGDSDPELLVEYGLVLREAGKDDAAADYLRRGLNAGVKDTRAQAALGEWAVKNKQYAEAQEWLAPAVEAAPAEASLRVWLARAQEGAGEGEKAAATLRKALTAVRDQSPLFLELGELSLRGDNLADAAKAFAEASAFRSTRGAALEAAKCYYQLGRFSLALEYADLAAAARPDDEETLEWRKKIEDAHFLLAPSTAPAATDPASRPAQP
jgi:tetratricopeptide (TPR) repeat protein